MARKVRIHFPGALYHVIARGNRRQRVFLDEKDFDRFLTYISHVKSRYPLRLYAYALMKNHLHLLAEVEEIPLSRIMQSLLFGYARYFNRRYGEVGHLFQGRYKAILVDKEAYLLELVRYIHLNPVRAKMVRGPEEYVWTGHLSYLGEGESKLLDTAFVLGQFGKNRSLAKRRYRQFVWDGISSGHEAKYYEVKDQRYLGEDDFVDRIERKKKGMEDWFYDIPLETISREVSTVMGIREEKLYSLTRDREGAEGRGIVAYLARSVSGYQVKDIADHFGRSAVTIGEAIMKAEDRMKKDTSLDKELRCIRERLVKGKNRKYRVTVA